GAAEQCNEFPSPHGFTRAEDYIGQKTKYHIFGLRNCAAVTPERATAMSAQKQTLAHVRVMPALPPKADIRPDDHSSARAVPILAGCTQEARCCAHLSLSHFWLKRTTNFV